jgi:hypothetical protein
MNDQDIQQFTQALKDIQQFTQALKDFMIHAETEIDSYLKWQEARSYTTSYYEELASKYEITIDYLLMEFIV